MPKPERLMVIEPFGDYERGDRIEDAAAMQRALSSHPQHVLREASGPEVEAVVINDAGEAVEEEKPRGGGKAARGSGK